MTQFSFCWRRFSTGDSGTADTNDLRVWFQNVDCLASAADFDTAPNAIIAADIDIIILADIRWDDHTRVGVRDVLRRRWAGNFWSKDWLFNQQPDAPTHGLFVAIRDPWSRFLEFDRPDSRGWARYAWLRRLPSPSPCPRDLRRVRLPVLENLRRIRLGDGPDPTRYHGRRGAHAVEPAVPRLGRPAGTDYVLFSDWNVTWSPEARLNAMSTDYQRHYEKWRAWFGRQQKDSLVNAF